MTNVCKEVDFEQGSKKWLAWRKTKITGTDSAKIMGKNKYTTAFDLYEEKVGDKKIFITKAMQHGMDLEPVARAMLESMHGISYSPKCFESVEYPHLATSLDAVSDDKSRGAEIKCVGYATMMRALNDDPDEMYLIQCQKHMMITRS